jgi:hypothetical protein
MFLGLDQVFLLMIYLKIYTTKLNLNYLGNYLQKYSRDQVKRAWVWIDSILNKREGQELLIKDRVSRK